MIGDRGACDRGKGRTSFGNPEPVPCATFRASRSCSIWLIRLILTSLTDLPPEPAETPGAFRVLASPFDVALFDQMAALAKN